MKKRASRVAAGEGWALIQTCPRCGRDRADCRCGPQPERPAGQPVARLRVEKRRGKPVTVCLFDGVPEADIRGLARDLRALCGSGGTAKGSEVELQGHHRAKLVDWLAERGYRVKG